MNCPNCGKENVDVAKFCIKCGADLKSQPIYAEPKIPVGSKWVECPFCGRDNRQGANKCIYCEKYIDYSQVPWFRKNSFAILCFLIFIPVLFPVIVTGDIYYKWKGELYTYGRFWRIIITYWGVIFILGFIIGGALIIKTFLVPNPAPLISKNVEVRHDTGERRIEATIPPEKEPNNSQHVSPAQVAFKHYLSELQQLEPLERKAVEGYNSIVKDSTASPAVSETIMASNLPTIIYKYKEFKEKLTQITPDTDELRKLHTQYVRSVTLQLEAMSALQVALDRRDKSAFDASQKKLNIAREQMHAYQSSLKAFAERMK